MEKENETPMESAEELEAEQGHLAEVKEDEIRNNIISDFGFDAETDKEKIDKLVERETQHRKTLSTTIGQKIKYREALNSNKSNPPKTDAKESKDTKEDLDKRVNAGVAKALEQRDLDEMEYPDEIKDVIKQVAKINKTTVKQAVKDPYVATKIDAWKKEQGTEEAALSRNNNTGGKPSSSTSANLTPPDVDLNTEEGRKEYDEWKNKMIAQGH